MRQIDNNFEDFFREQFEDYESAPNTDSWQQIQARLHAKRRRIALWWWIPTGIAALLVGFLCLKSFSDKNRTPQNNVAKIENTTQKDSAILPKINTSETLKELQNTPSENNLAIENKIQNEAKTNILPNISPKKATFHYEETHISNERTVFHEVPNIENSTPNTPLQNTQIEEIAKPKSKEKISFAFLPILLNEVFSGEEISIKMPPSTTVETKNNIIKKRFSPSIIASLNAAPTYNFRNISPNKTDNNYVNNIANPATLSTERIGLQVGTDIDFKLTKHLGFATLFNYQYTPFQVAYDLRKNETPTIEGLVTNKGNSLNINSVSYQTSQEILTQNLHSVNAAFALNFYSNEKNKWSAGMGTGKWFGKDRLSGTPFYTTFVYTHTFKKGLKIAPFFRYDFKNYTLNNKILEIQPYQFGLKFQL